MIVGLVECRNLRAPSILFIVCQYTSLSEQEVIMHADFINAILYVIEDRFDIIFLLLLLLLIQQRLAMDKVQQQTSDAGHSTIILLANTNCSNHFIFLSVSKAW